MPRISISVSDEFYGKHDAGPARFVEIAKPKGRGFAPAFDALFAHGTTVFELLAHDLIGRLEAEAKARNTTVVELVGAFLSNETPVSSAAYRPAPEILNDLDSDKAKRTVGTAAYRIAEAVREIMAEGKWAITGGLVQKRCGSNRQSINRWLDEHQAVIDEYHARIGAEDLHRHNAQVAREVRENA